MLGVATGILVDQKDGDLPCSQGCVGYSRDTPLKFKRSKICIAKLDLRYLKWAIPEVNFLALVASKHC